MTNERPANAIGNVMWDLPGGMRFNVWLSGDVEFDASVIDGVFAAIDQSVLPERIAAVRPTPAAKSGGGGGGGYPSSGVFCESHNAEMRKSDPKFDKDGDRWFHSLDEAQWYTTSTGATAKNHTLYWRQTVDSDGESNAGREQPSGQSTGRVADTPF